MRKLLTLIHLYLAAFVAPAFFLLAISGGLYLIGIKGEMRVEPLTIPEQAQIDLSSATLQEDFDSLLKSAGVQHSYDYLKVRGDRIQTRPTSQIHLELVQTEQGWTLSRNYPSLQKRMIELHKGHGPSLFKTYQKGVAIALLLIVLSGLIMGLLAPSWRRKTILTSGAGLIIFIVLLL